MNIVNQKDFLALKVREASSLLTDILQFQEGVVLGQPFDSLSAKKNLLLRTMSLFEGEIRKAYPLSLIDEIEDQELLQIFVYSFKTLPVIFQSMSYLVEEISHGVPFVEIKEHVHKIRKILHYVNLGISRNSIPALEYYYQPSNKLDVTVPDFIYNLKGKDNELLNEEKHPSE